MFTNRATRNHLNSTHSLTSQALVAHLALSLGAPHRVERCVLHLDVTSMDLDQVCLLKKALGMLACSRVEPLLFSRVGQNRIYTPYMTVYLVLFLPKILYIHPIYIWFWPTLLFSRNKHWP
jgi:hypothetical protein